MSRTFLVLIIHLVSVSPHNIHSFLILCLLLISVYSSHFESKQKNFVLCSHNTNGIVSHLKPMPHVQVYYIYECMDIFYLWGAASGSQGTINRSYLSRDRIHIPGWQQTPLVTMPSYLPVNAPLNQTYYGPPTSWLLSFSSGLDGIRSWPLLSPNHGFVGSFTRKFSSSFPDYYFSFAKNANPLYLIIYSLFFMILCSYNNMQAVMPDN